MRLVREPDRGIAAVARDFGLHPETLRVRVGKAEADEGCRGDRRSSADCDESLLSSVVEAAVSVARCAEGR